MCKVLQKINAVLGDIRKCQPGTLIKSEPYITIIAGLIKIVLTAELFYGNWYLAVPFMFLFIPLRKQGLKNKERQEQALLDKQFADALNSMSFAVEVGYSMENAVREALKDMRVMYGSDAMIVKALAQIINKMEVNITVEQAFDEFADGSGNEDICYFAHVLALAKRSGGNLNSVLRNTAQRICKKLEVKSEIDTIVSGKKMEQAVMSVIPYGMIAYLRITSPEFVVPLYGNIVGIAVMTVCLLVCTGAGRLSKRFLAIQV